MKTVFLIIIILAIAGCNREPPIKEVPSDERTKELIRKADSMEVLYMNTVNEL